MAGTPVSIHNALECQRDLRQALHLVYDDRQSGLRCLARERTKLAIRIEGQRREEAFIIEVEETGGFDHVPNQRCLARLARTDDIDHPSRSQSALELFSHVPGDKGHGVHLIKKTIRCK